jgi:ubiquinone/menaquinone biosynthesis C-methylase UbiE
MNTDYYLKADLYDKYRWNYPQAAVNWILDKAKIDNRSVLCDVGAGTGKLTELFSSKAKEIYAVEPDDKMLEILRRKKLKNVVLIQDYSDSIQEVENHSIDAIIVAHALHWFKYPSTLNEFNRILKNTGTLINVSNVYKEKKDVNDEIERAIEKYRKPTNYQNKSDIVLNDYFQEYEENKFEFSFTNDIASYIGGICSASFYPDESDGEIFYKIEKIITEVFNKRSTNGKIKMNCECIVQVGKLHK